MYLFDENNNLDRETMAQNLYGAETQKEKQQEEERNKLLNNLGDNYENKHIFYSNEELKKENELLAKAGKVPELSQPKNEPAKNIQTSQEPITKDTVSPAPFDYNEDFKNKYSHNIQASRNHEEQKRKCVKACQRRRIKRRY